MMGRPFTECPITTVWIAGRPGTAVAGALADHWAQKAAPAQTSAAIQRAIGLPPRTGPRIGIGNAPASSWGGSRLCWRPTTPSYRALLENLTGPACPAPALSAARGQRGGGKTGPGTGRP